MNKIMLLLFFLFLIFILPAQLPAAEQISVIRNFPNFTIASKIILKARDPSSLNPCPNGTIFVDSNDGQLKWCDITGGVRPPIWIRDGNNIYTANDSLRPLDQVIIGRATQGANIPFTVAGLNSSSVENQIYLSTSTAIGNAIFSARNYGTPAGGINDRAYYDFHVGEHGLDFDARITYLNLPGVAGLDLMASPGMSNIFISAAHTVGIGNNYAPTQQMDVNGNTETTRLFLKSNPSYEKELKVEYDVAGGGGYYAVYAP